MTDTTITPNKPTAGADPMTALAVGALGLLTNSNASVRDALQLIRTLTNERDAARAELALTGTPTTITVDVEHCPRSPTAPTPPSRRTDHDHRRAHHASRRDRGHPERAGHRRHRTTG